MAPVGKMVWVGRVISALVGALFIFSAAMKFKGGPEFAKAMEHLQLPDRMTLPLGILEAICVLVYFIPQTAVLGAVLLTGYLGGAMLTHWRIGEPVYTHIVIGGLVWLGIYLRDRRLWSVLPLRRP